MSSQTPSYDMLKTPPRQDVRGDQYNHRNRSDKIERELSDEKHTRKEPNTRETFVKFLSGLNTTVKDAVIPVFSKNTDVQEELAIIGDNIIKPDTTIINIGEINRNNQNILASPELILSDLLAIDLNALKDGEVIHLPNDIDVSLKDGLLNFSFDGETIQIPELSLEQFEEFKIGFENILLLNDGTLIDENSINEILAAPIITTDNDLTITQNIPVPQLNTIKEIVNILQSAIAIKNVMTHTATTKTVSTQNVNVTEPKIVDEKSVSLGSTKSDNNNSLSLSESLAQKNSNVGQNNPVTNNTVPQKEMPQNVLKSFFAPVVPVSADATNNNDAESLTQFLNNNNLRIVKNGHLQSTQPLGSSQVNAVISKMANGSQFKRLSVRLDPAELGRIDIKLSTRTSDNSLRAHIIVERPEALTLLRRDMAQLEKMLSQTGLNLDNDSISFDLASDDGNKSDNQTQEAIKDLWREKNESGLHKNLASNLQSNSQSGDDISLNDEILSDDAVNIRV